MDRRPLGVDRTVGAIDASGLARTGTRAKGDTTSPWYAVTEQGGLRLAWVACTYGTNGISDPYGQVLQCFSQASVVEQHVRDLSARSDIDAVIVTPHWGQEYQATPERAQTDLAHRFLNAGATVILGSHPHVLQPWEKFVTSDGRETWDGQARGAIVGGYFHAHLASNPQAARAFVEACRRG